MPGRYTDFVPGAPPPDFVTRRRKPTMLELAAIFLFTLILSVTLPAIVLDTVTLTFWLSLLLAVAGWYAAAEIQRSRDLVLATEFQNALFASALGFSNKFCLIIKQEGHIVYMDRAFQETFPEVLRERPVTVATLLRHARVALPDKEKIFAAVERGVYEKLIFDVYAGGALPERIVMSFEPILRPAGFMLLRAREYAEERPRDARAESVFTPQAGLLLTRSSISLFSYIMDRMQVGVVMTGPAGNIVYANPAIEQWLAYREEEMISAPLSLKDVVDAAHISGAGAPADFEGDATLHKKGGGLIKVFLSQKAIIGDDGKLLGCVVLVHKTAENSSLLRKILW